MSSKINRQINIALIDDDPAHCMLIRQLLKKAEADIYILQTAGTLKDGLAMLEETCCDVLLLDLHLPDSTGLATLEKVISRFPDIPVVVVTASKEKELGIKAIQNGATDYLVKDDINVDLLERAVRYAIERKNIEKQLKHQRDLAQKYLNAAGMMVVVTNLNGTVRFLNNTSRRILGVFDNEIAGMPWIDRFIDPKDRKRFKQCLCQLASNPSSEVPTIETTIIDANNYPRIISWTNVPILDKTGKIESILCAGADMTQLKKSEQMLQNANNLLKQFNDFRNEFVITVTHELRTPLTIFKNIISNALAGVSGRISKKLRDDLIKADEAINRLKEIVNDLLDLSNIDTGRINTELKPVCIQEIVRDSIKSMSPLIDKNNMTVDIEMPEKKIVIPADKKIIKQALCKIIDNATVFVPDCGGRLRVKVEDLDEHVCIAIEDNGPGIQTNNIESIFDRFVQAGKRVGPGKHGLGLGLAICKELIELHNGTITAENLPEGGARFTIYLPKQQSPRRSANQETLAETIDSVRMQLNDINGLIDKHHHECLDNKQNKKCDF